MVKQILIALVVVSLFGIVLGLPSAHAVTPQLQSQIPPTEYDALVALFTSTTGISWTNHTDWLVTDTPCSWYGVTCAGDVVSHVTSIYFLSNNLSGTLPIELGNLSNLQDLTLFGNPSLHGGIPPQLGNLTNLVTLNFHGNQLTGAIPAELGNMINLTYILLSQNELTGPIPPELGNLTYLFMLQLTDNQLTGPVPSTLGNLSGLRMLYLDYNQLYGPLPASLTAIPLISFNFTQTDLCEPRDALFQAWLDGISDLYRTNVLCASDLCLPLVQRGS